MIIDSDQSRRSPSAVDNGDELSNAQVFEVTFNYDERMLRAAAKFLFWRNWKAKRVSTMVSLFALLLAAGLILYVGLPSLLWWVGLFLLANLALWAYLRWATQRNLMRLLGKSQQIRLTEMDFSISSTDGSHTFPWTRFVSTGKDGENAYLFLTRSLAYILPIRQVSEEACEFALSHIAGVSDKP